MVSEYVEHECMTIFNGGVGSIGPDPGLYCELFHSAQCTDDLDHGELKAYFTYPGFYVTPPGYYSYRCDSSEKLLEAPSAP